MGCYQQGFRRMLLVFLCRQSGRVRLVGTRTQGKCLSLAKSAIMSRTRLLVCALLFILLAAPVLTAQDARLGHSSRQDRAGWVYVHLEGTPSQIGFQHGYLLAPEIDDSLKMFTYFVKRSYGKDWAFFRQAAKRLFWPKLEPEYRKEIEGIAAGLKARGKKYDAIDVTALNGWMEIAWYYIPAFDEAAKKAGKRAGEHCSAFIATGSYTKDRKIVMAHNAWVDYIVGERWNVIADIVPKRGHRIMMDSYPGFIHSGDDFVMTDAGILITETTISGFKGFSEKGTPEFMRARKAAQYAKNIDDFVRIMTDRNNGGYANDWLVGDTKTNEIARLELGLKHHRVWRTKDGILYGSNFPLDEKVTKEETNFDPTVLDTSATSRRLRWEEAGESAKGKLDAGTAMRLVGDHFDQAKLRQGANCRTLCGHLEIDPVAMPDAGWPAYYPGGAAQGKVTTAALAGKLSFWARMGHPCGQDFLTKPFFKAHPQYKWQSPFLHDMKGHAWTLFRAGK